MGLTPEQMKSVVSNRAAYGQMERQDALTEMKRAQTVQALADANDLVDVGGVAVPRDKVASVISAQAYKNYTEGKITNEQLTAENKKALLAAQTAANIASAKGDMAKAEYNRKQAEKIQRQLAAIEQYGGKSYDELTPGQILAMGGSPSKPSDGNQVLNANQAIARLKENFFQQGELNAMKAIRGHAQEKYQKAKTIMVELHKKGLSWTKAAEKATEAVENAEAVYWQDYYSLSTEAERRELKKDFYTIMHYVPKKNAGAKALGE